MLLLPLRGTIVRDSAIRSPTDNRQLEVACASPGVQPADGRLAATPLKRLRLKRAGFGEGGGGAYSLSCISRMTIDPRTPTMSGRSTSGFHRPGLICLHDVLGGGGRDLWWKLVVVPWLNAYIRAPNFEVCVGYADVLCSTQQCIAGRHRGGTLVSYFS